jgi:hypothetical protein
MSVEVGNPVVGIEVHRLFEVAHRRLHRGKRDKGQEARLRDAIAVSTQSP